MTLQGSVRAELLRCLCLLPMTSVNLRSPVEPRLTASDASGLGGGVCVSAGLSTEGVAAAKRCLAGDLGTGRDHVGLLSLCDGIGGARRALELLNVEVCGYASCEHGEAARRIVKVAWPDVVDLGPLTEISSQSLQRWRSSMVHLRVLIVSVSANSIELLQDALEVVRLAEEVFEGVVLFRMVEFLGGRARGDGVEVDESVLHRISQLGWFRSLLYLQWYHDRLQAPETLLVKLASVTDNGEFVYCGWTVLDNQGKIILRGAIARKTF